MASISSCFLTASWKRIATLESALERIGFDAELIPHRLPTYIGMDEAGTLLDGCWQAIEQNANVSRGASHFA